jgi:hypothetical protein
VMRFFVETGPDGQPCLRHEIIRSAVDGSHPPEPVPLTLAELRALVGNVEAGDVVHLDGEGGFRVGPPVPGD